MSLTAARSDSLTFGRFFTDRVTAVLRALRAITDHLLFGLLRILLNFCAFCSSLLRMILVFDF